VVRIGIGDHACERAAPSSQWRECDYSAGRGKWVRSG
jgi:hypothetical protein